jgi:hypothetical protein
VTLSVPVLSIVSPSEGNSNSKNNINEHLPAKPPRRVSETKMISVASNERRDDDLKPSGGRSDNVLTDKKRTSAKGGTSFSRLLSEETLVIRY